MDIKSWILLIGTLLIVAVICHGFWTAYRARKTEVRNVRMAIESDLPEGDLDDEVLLSGELPNGGARVTPTVGYDSLRVQERHPQIQDSHELKDPLEEALLALDDAVASAEQGLVPESDLIDEGDFDAGYKPEQATLDLEMEALEERFAARAAATTDTAPLLTDAQMTDAHTEDSQLGPVHDAEELSPAGLPPKKQITPELAAKPPRKQFEPPFPEELEEQREAERLQAEKVQAARERAERKQEELAAIAKQEAEREARLQAKVEAQRLQRIEQQEREAQARIDAENREKARAEAKAQMLANKQVQTGKQEQLSLAPEPVVEFPDSARGQSSGLSAVSTQDATPSASLPPVEELVVLNVISKTRPFHGGDVLELFLRNGIKFGDMNIFHRIDPVTKLSQYSIASVTEPGYFDLQAMPGQEFRGLCLFMQLPCSGQATKVFTDMLTVADKLARQLDGEVCDEQYNRLTRQSTEHYRQRVAEFTRRNMSRRA